MDSLDLLCDRLLRLESWGGEFAIAASVYPSEVPIREPSIPGLVLQSSRSFDITFDPNTRWPIRCEYFFQNANDSRLQVWLDIAIKCREITGRHPVELLINHPIEKYRPKRWVNGVADIRQLLNVETSKGGDYRISNPISDLRDALVAMKPQKSPGASDGKGGRKPKTKLDLMEKKVLDLKRQGHKPADIDRELKLKEGRASQLIRNAKRRDNRQNARQNRPK